MAFPITPTQSAAEAYGYIRDVYRTIITRDLVQKFALPDTQVLERLAEYMLDNSGNPNSPNKIAGTLDANKVSTNHVTVGRYMSHLRDAFERELSTLLSIKDAYPKALIARTMHGAYDIDGVRVLDIARWLADEQGF